MTRKHFERLANVVKVMQREPWQAEQWHGIVRSLTEPQARLLAFCLANVCGDSNPRFDRERFYEACGLGDSNENLPTV